MLVKEASEVHFKNFALLSAPKALINALSVNDVCSNVLINGVHFTTSSFRIMVIILAPSDRLLQCQLVVISTHECIEGQLSQNQAPLFHILLFVLSSPTFSFSGPFWLTWINLNPLWINNYTHYNLWRVGWNYLSTPKLQRLRHSVNAAHISLCMWLLIHAGIEVHPCY